MTPIAAGSVNTNYFLDSAAGRFFFRVYEEQDDDGVAYEWALLDHLRDAGVPVPARIPGPGPGELRVAGKPTALFGLAPGRDICFGMFDPERAERVGRMLARVHNAGESFPHARESRFNRDTVRSKLSEAEAHGRPELVAPIARLRALSERVEETYPTALKRCVIHGDMFRDNVFWEGDQVSAIIDWESASTGECVFDLAVVFLAWCFGDRFVWENARALGSGYQSLRPLSEAEREGFRCVALAAAIRFATTRILDFHLRSDGVGERVMKDYRRFLARIDEIEALSAEQLSERLFGR